jgi:hypothetical protein
MDSKLETMLNATTAKVAEQITASEGRMTKETQELKQRFNRMDADFDLVKKEIQLLKARDNDAASAASAATSTAPSATRPSSGPASGPRVGQLGEQLRDGVLECKGFPYNSWGNTMRVELRRCIDAHEMLQTDDIVEIRAPYTRSSKVNIVFASSAAREEWYTLYRKVRDRHPLSFRTTDNTELYITKPRPREVRLKNALAWRAKTALFECIPATDHDLVELIWGRHVMLTDQGKTEIAKLDRTSTPPKWIFHAQPIVAKWGEEVFRKIGALTSDLTLND